MDLLMKAEVITSSSNPVWDVKVENGNVPIITDDKEDLQCATLAAFLVKGSVPQLEDAGVPWNDFLTQKITFGELDYYIRDSLNNVEKQTFYPSYDIADDKLTLSIGKLEQEDAVDEL
jgi:hypothetical protein